MEEIKLKFLKSAVTKLNLDTMAEVILIGKSNAGKSSFINNLANNKNLAYISQKPGKTDTLNYYQIDNTKAYLIDTPGYGYHIKGKIKNQQFDQMMHDLFTIDPFKIKIIFWIYDIRRTFDSKDLEIISFLKKAKLFDKLSLILTKIDKESNNFLNNKLTYFYNNLKINKDNIYYISNVKKTNIIKVQKNIKNILKLN